MSSLKTCLDAAKNITASHKQFILDQAEGYKKQGISEIEADVQALVDYHSALNDKLNEARTFLSLPAYTLPQRNIPEIVKGIRAKYVPSQNIAPQTQGTVVEGIPIQLGGLKTDSQYRVAVTNEVDRITDEQWKEFETWASENIPQVPVSRLKHLIEMTGGGFAWGALEDGMIKVYQNAEVGTEYHEAFEAVWKYFVPQQEQEAILQEMSKRKGSFFDRLTLEKIDYSKATAQQLKERAADEFADYRISNSKPKGLLAKFFEDLINFFKALFSGDKLAKRLFAKIDTGYYKSHAIDPRKLQGVEYASVGGLGEQRTNELVQHVTARVFQIATETNKSLFNIDSIIASTTFRTIRAELERDSVIPDDAWRHLVRLTQDFLRSFNVRFEEQEDKLSFNDDDRSRNEYETDAFKVDVKGSAPAAIKMLIASLVESKFVAPNKIGSQNSSIGGYTLAKFSKSFITILDRVANTNKFKNMVPKLAALARENANYARLFNKLKGDWTTGELDYRTLNFDDWRLLVSFHAAFGKQKPEPLIQYIGASGEAYTQSAELTSVANRVKNEWTQNMRALSKDKNSPISYNSAKKTYKINQNYVNNINLQTQKFDLLENLGITFSEAMYNDLSDDDKNKFNDAVASIKKFLGKKDEIYSLEGNTLNITGPLNLLASLYTKLNFLEPTNTVRNVDNEQEQVYVNNNFASVIANDFNSVKTRDELFHLRPELKDVWSTNSLLLKLGGRFFNADGTRTSTELRVGRINGTVDQEKDRRRVTSKLNLGERLLQEINQNFGGWYYTLVPADASTEWMMNFGNFMTFTEFETNPGPSWGKIYEQFKKYLSDEIAVVKDYNNRKQVLQIRQDGERLRFFKDILPWNLEEKALASADTKVFLEQNRAAIHQSFENFIKRESAKQLIILKRGGQITVNKDDTFKFPRLDSSFTAENSIDRFKMTEKELNRILDYRTANYIMSNIEFHKVLFGDPYQFKDELKRIKSFLSPRGTVFNDSDFDAYLNIDRNKGLNPGDIGYHEFKPYVPTVTFSNLEVIGSTALNPATPADIADEYSKKLDEADAQAWIMPNTFRELDIKNGVWDEDAEAFYQWDMALARKDANQSLDGDDKILANKPEGYFARVIKPIVTGVKYGASTIDVIVDKTSMFPMFYSFVRGTNLAKMFYQMQKQGVGYGIVHSGRKVGAEQLHNIYNPDGTFNDAPFENIINISWDSFGIQQETSYKEGNKGTRGSQVTKIATVNLLDGGVPVDVSEKYTIEQWVRLSEEAKLNESSLYKEIKKNQFLLEEMTNIGYENLLRKLGIIDRGGYFEIPDKSKVSELLRSEVLRREVSSNVTDALTLNEAGEFIVPLEATNVYQQIKNILFSVVDKTLISPKVNGGPKVQVSAAMWESNKRKAVYKKDGKWVEVADYESLTEDGRATVRLTSNDLKFYTLDDGKVKACEILIPHWFGKRLRDKGVKMNDEELLKHINSSPDLKKILRGIGFRIPTQELNSIEVFKVKGFLPQEMGDTVIVPSEITKKAGSDFDIDKLNTYLKNVHITNTGELHYIEYKGSRLATEDFYSKFYDDAIEFAKEKTQDKIQKTDFLLKIVQDFDLGLLSENVIEKHSKLINDIFENIETDATDFVDSLMKQLEKKGEILEKLNDAETQAIFKAMFVDKMYEKSLENEYFESIEKLVLTPRNFNRLITPNTPGELPGLRDKLVKISKEEFGSTLPSLMSPAYMVQTRHNNIIAKGGGVGIAAVNQANHTLTQRQPIVIDTSRIAGLPEDEKIMLGNGNILLAHNHIDIGGKRMATISKILDTAKKYITDKISAYINGYVDVSKDTYITEIGATPATAGTFLFLERIGVTTPTVVYFMNQPIIRDFIRAVEARGGSRLDRLDIAETVRKLYPSKMKATKIDEKKLEKNIIKRYKDKKDFDAADNAEQQLILSEFLKYYVMANHLFHFVQGVTYDTANISDNTLLHKKRRQTEFVKDQNLFTSIEELLNNSFIGNVAEKTEKTQDAIGEILRFEKRDVRNILRRVLEPFSKPGKYINTKDLQKIGNKATHSFIDYIFQTNSPEDMSRYKELLLNIQTSVARKLYDIKKQLDKKYDSTLAANPVIAALSPATESDGVQIVKLELKDTEPYTTNLYTGAMRELRDNTITEDLYEELVLLALFQSGSARSPISYTHIIPIEDYADKIIPVISRLGELSNLEEFVKNAAFYRNNWNDNDIVPTVEPAFFGPNFDIGDYETVEFSTPSFRIPASLQHRIKDRGLLLLSSKYNRRAIDYPVVKHKTAVQEIKGPDKVDVITGKNILPSQFARAKKEGSKYYQQVFGYKRVEDTAGNPLVIAVSYKGDIDYKYVYKPINLWGKGQEAQEYYVNPRPSRINNNTRVVAEELDDNEIINALKDDAVGPASIVDEKIKSGEIKKEC